jgi:hypothetical protein
MLAEQSLAMPEMVRLLHDARRKEPLGTRLTRSLWTRRKA